MTNQKKIALIGIVLVAMVLLVWMLSGGNNEAQKQKRIPFVSSNWTSRFQPFDKKPMGLYLFNSLLATHIDTNRSVYIANDWIELDSLRLSDSLPKTYLFVGNYFGLQNQEIDSIMSEVNEGSRIFLSFNGLTENIYPRFFNEYNARFDYAETINVFASKKKYHMINLFQNDTIADNWKAFGKIDPVGPYKSLSSFMEMENFIKVEHGKGYLYLHTTPSLYYNYQIKRKEGFAYTAYTINQLPKDQDVILLELGRLSDNFGNEDTDTQEGADGKEDDSYLKIIFENPTLLKAMLLGLLGVIIFVVFRSKRMRPVVPYIEKRKNMTLAFAETITSIYFSKRNPYGLLQLQRKNFYDTVQKHFFVDLARREGAREIEILAEKSNKSVEEINSLVNALESKEAFSVNEQVITDIAKQMRKFYTETGIINEKALDRVKEQNMIFRRGILLPIATILGGIFLILLGFYYLMNSVGVGIVMWPLGLIAAAIGVLRLSNPYMVINELEIVYYSPIGRKRKFLRDDLIRTEVKEKGVILNFTEDRKLIINNWDLSRFDQKQFERFIAKLHNQEL